jgi:hypothetical protein
MLRQTLRLLFLEGYLWIVSLTEPELEINDPQVHLLVILLNLIILNVSFSSAT